MTMLGKSGSIANSYLKGKEEKNRKRGRKGQKENLGRNQQT